MKKINLRRLVMGVAVACLVAGSAVATGGAASASSTSGWLHTSGATIKTASNKAYVIKSVSWFGMELSTCAPHGLWTISLDQGMAEIKSMGFNTIRLPYSNECIAASATTTINPVLNPNLFGKTPIQVMDAVVERANAYGLNIILDRHRASSSAQSALWYTPQYSEARWISDWKMLAARYKSNSNVVGFDLHNEPHGAAKWGTGGKKYDWQAAATRAGNAVLAVNPKVLIIVEGIASTSGGYKTSWGGALAGVAKKPVKLKVKNHVVYSAHDYPPSVNPQKFFNSANNKKLVKAWNEHWGFIVKKKIAPVLLGEFGSKAATTADKKWLTSMVGYLKSTKISFSYWSFNPNSSLTGGLVGDDWTTKETSKLNYLKPLLGSGSSVPLLVAVPTFTSVTPTGPIPDGNAAQWLPLSGWYGGYVAQIAVSSTGGLDHWSVTIPDAYATKIVQSWGQSCTINPGSSITCTGYDWGSTIAAGDRIVVGLQVESGNPPLAPALSVSG